MLDLTRLRRIKLPSRPPVQRAVAQALLRPNYGFLPGVTLNLEGTHRIPKHPVVYAMNHTDRYNYFPFQYQLYRTLDRFTATWVKGKYYENAVVGTFMEITANLPTVSRGYLIVRDFLAVTGSHPNDDEYRHLRQWVDAEYQGEPVDPEWRRGLPEALVSRGRDILGRRFHPGQESWAQAIVALYGEMMAEFRRLNARVFEVGLDLLVFPEGTRSVRLGPGRPGLAQLVLHHGLTVVPVGCNGSHRLYPGDSPWARKGTITYRIGEPLHPSDYRDLMPNAPFTPFTAEAERTHKQRFSALTDMIMQRIAALLDDEHQAAPDSEGETSGARRFV